MDEITVDELIERLQEISDRGCGNSEVRVALQPNYPLGASLSNICIEHTDAEEDDDDSTVWLAVSDGEDYSAKSRFWSDEETYADDED